MAFKIKKRRFTAKLQIKNSVIEIPGIEKQEGFSKFTGLMFANKENAPAMLFEFKNDGRKSIHSLFCPTFLAIWLNENNKIIEYKIVSPYSLSISPEKNFRKLIEVPLNKKYTHIVEFILERGKF